MPQAPESGRLVQINSPAMAENDRIAGENRRVFDEHGILAVDLMSSPGSGKTSLLEAMAGCLGDAMVVIEGDVQTRRDAERIERAGCRAYQIETRGACHLDAKAVAQALEHLDLRRPPCTIAVIENVGNLICPSSYYLGEHLRMALLSLPEGDDKILKYPALFSRISLLVISKIDLLPYLHFDIDRAIGECRSLSLDVKTLRTSAVTGEGIRELCGYLMDRRTEVLQVVRCPEV